MLKASLKKYLTPKNVILFSLLIIFFLILRWNSFTAPFERDEGEYAYSAWLMRRGILPYENTFPNKPPMIIFTNVIGQVLFGDQVWSPRLMAMIFSFITIVIVGLIVKREYGSFAGWISLFLLSIMLILPGGYGNSFLADVYYAANTEIFMILPMVALLFLYRVYGESANLKVWFLAGVLSSLALNYKPICLFVIAYIFVFWLVGTWKYQKNATFIIKRVAVALAGLTLATFLIYLPFLISDGGRAVTDQLINYTGCYIKSDDWQVSLNRIITRIMILGKYYWLLFVLLIYYLIKKPRDWSFYFGLFLTSFLSISPSIMGHFFIQIMPFFALVSAVALNEITKEKIFHGKNVLLVIVVMISILWPVRQLFNKSPKELGLWVYGPYDQYYEAEIVGKKMAEITNPSDYVFVAGDDIEMVYFSQRRSSVRLEFINTLTINCKMLEKYQNDYFKDFKNNPPKAITVCFSGSCSYIWSNEKARPFMEYLTKTINENYYAVGGWIPNNQGGYWLEPIKQAEIPSARSVLFKTR